MTLTKEQIMTEAMKLDPVDRETLAEDLLLSVGGDDRAQIDKAWLAEAYRRDSALAAGKTTARPVDDVIRRLRGEDRP